MKFKFLLLFTLLAGAPSLYAQSHQDRRTEIETLLQVHNSTIRQRYQWLEHEGSKLSFSSQNQSPGYLGGEYKQGMSLNINYKMKKDRSLSMNMALDQTVQSENPRKYMLNFTHHQKLTEKLSALLNIYSDKYETQPWEPHSNFNSTLQYQLTPRFGVSISSFAGLQKDSPLVLSQMVGATINF